METARTSSASFTSKMFSRSGPAAPVNLRRKPVAPFDLRRVVRKVPVVPETKALHEVMDELRARHAHVSFVVDEFGTITGFLSMEDVMEQLRRNRGRIRSHGQSGQGCRRAEGRWKSRAHAHPRPRYPIPDQLPDDLEVGRSPVLCSASAASPRKATSDHDGRRHRHRDGP